MTRAEILKGFQIDEYGIIRSKGKFESEMIYAPYFYDKIMAGQGEEVTAEDGNGYSTFFDISNEDRAEFPELGETKRVECYESTDGFFYCIDAST